MSLDVYLCEQRIGTLSRAGGNDYQLAYAPELVRLLGSGKPLLSSSLPVRREPHSPRASRAYVEGLLPEGRHREGIALELGIDPGDGYALIAEIGRDCPGAVVFLPHGEGIEHCDSDSIAWLGEGELAEMLSPPEDMSSDGAERRARSTLGGNRHKLSLVRNWPEGGWARPEPGLPGTHIVKPETGEHPELAVNEMFCMAVLRQAGLPAVRTSVETIAGHTCLVSPRFDLTWEGSAPKRVHQESFCQALGIAPGAAADSAEAEAPGFAEAAGLLRAMGVKKTDVTMLVHAAFANYVLGNGNAHGRKFALLFRDDGFQLAPLYGVTSTLAYDEPTETGMVLPDEDNDDAYLRGMSHVAEEFGIELDIFQIQATCALSYLCDAIDVVADRAEEDGWYAPVVDDIFELARERARRCAKRLLHWDLDT